jgi:hypothetical protein
MKWNSYKPWEKIFKECGYRKVFDNRKQKYGNYKYPTKIIYACNDFLMHVLINEASTFYVTLKNRELQVSKTIYDKGDFEEIQFIIKCLAKPKGIIPCIGINWLAPIVESVARAA